MLVPLVPGPVLELEDVLDVLEQPARGDRRVQTGVELAFPTELARVDRVVQDAVDFGLRELPAGCLRAPG